MKHGASTQTGSSEGEPGAEDWSVRGNGENTIKRRPGLERPGREEEGTSPSTRLSGGEPGATDWSVRGNRENTTKERPRMELPGRNEA